MRTDNHKVSLVICTKDRKPALKQLVSSILRTVYRSNVPIVIIDQSQQPVKKMTRGVQYIHLEQSRGLSVARNKALLTCRTPMIAFTDDDCIVTRQYMITIRHMETKLVSNDVALIFGTTTPFKPERHKNETCPCTFSKTDYSRIHTIVPHWSRVGYGNNMIMRTSIVSSIGAFKPWLGAGSVGESAEDAEYILRCLIAGYTVAYNPKLIIQHNRWLSDKELRIQLIKYSCGGLAAYGFYYFQGVSECKLYFRDHLLEIFDRIINDLRLLRRDPHRVPYTIFAFALELYFTLKGIFLAFTFARIIPIPLHEDVVRKYYRQTAPHNA